MAERAIEQVICFVLLDCLNATVEVYLNCKFIYTTHVRREKHETRLLNWMHQS